MKKMYIALTAALLVFSGCIKETYPTTYVLADQIGQSESALDGMVNAIYTTMAGYKNSDGGLEMISYGGMRVMLEHTTSQMVCSGANGYNTMGAYAQLNVSATGSNRGLYPSYLYYAYIKNVNDIIGILAPQENLDAGKKAILGQCYAYRALYYLDLVQIMEWKKPTDTRYKWVDPKLGPDALVNLGVPIVTDETPAEQLSNNPRAKVDEVYDLILSDLGKAEGLLDGFVRTDKVQPDLGVVYGLYARAYLNLASRVKTAETYKDEADYWTKAASYADKAITTSGCTPLTEDQWTDPVNGFNNRNSQNSWMLSTTISESNTAAASTESFVFAMIMGTETDFSVYGWRVGRSLARNWYERLSDNDWRKKSWLAPEFFYESTNQVPGGKYLVEKDASGNLINNKWAKGSNSSNVQEDWSDDYDGTGTHSYRLTSSPSWIRSRINKYYGFQGWPWLYVNIKFRPHNGAYNVYTTGGATDYPCMRVEEMYFIKAEALAHSQSVGAGKAALEEIVKTRNSTYSCNASSLDAFIEEMYFQKGIEFWGEGVPYFDAKRLERGIHRAYLGTNLERYQHGFDIDGPYTGMTPGWNQAELNANPAIFDYNNPHTPQASLYVWAGNDDFRPYYGCEINTEGMKY